MKQSAKVIIVMMLGVLLTACGTEDDTVSDNSSDDETQENGGDSNDAQNDNGIEGTIEPDEFDKVFSDPKKYKNYEVTFSGQVFAEPEQDEDGVYLQVFADPENQDQNVIVGINDPGFEVETEDYVKIEGVIQDEFEGQNAYGGDIVAPAVAAKDVEVVDYVTAVSPSLETIDVDETQNQNGYVIDLEKIEIADNMTRVYLTITNNTDDKISFYDFNSKLLIDKKQLEVDSDFYNTGLPELQSEILPGAETEGVIIFPSVDPDIDSLTLHAEGSSDNLDLNLEPFEFEINQQD